VEVLGIGNRGNAASVNRDRSIRFHRGVARIDDCHMQKDERSIAGLRHTSAEAQQTEKQ
jgi:hypothetical protein